MKSAPHYEAPTVTVDGVIFTIRKQQLQVLIAKRSDEPFRGKWALPGGYCNKDQTTVEALALKLREKTGVDLDNDTSYVEQLYTYDSIGQDPRGHAICVSFFACGVDIAAGGGSHEIAFYPVNRLPKLAYNHKEVIEYARDRLASKLMYSTIAFSLLPDKFTLADMQAVYEAVLGQTLDKRNFRKKILALNFLHETGEISQSGAHRPAALYAFNATGLEVLSQTLD